MNLDAKQKLLLAIYIEYQKDIPDMGLLSNAILDMDEKSFRVALNKLQSESLISGTKLHFMRNDPYPNAENTQFVQMTREGIEFAEEKMKIDKFLSGKEKLEVLQGKFSDLGWTALSDSVNKALAEM